MSFISPSAHKKFITQCQNLINDISANEIVDEKAERLKADLKNLQGLAEVYLNMMSKLPGIAHEYKELQRRIRINARKIRPVKSIANGSRLFAK